MRQLLLLRHAKSASNDVAGSDHGRTLNEAGVTAATAIGRTMHAQRLTPDVVLVSSARRTLQTLAALEPWDDAPLVEPMDALYLATAPQLLAVLHRVADTVRSVLLIGHNPGLHDLALFLTKAAPSTTPSAEKRPSGKLASRLAAGFPTGALAEFTIAARWCDLGEGGGRLARFLSPKDLPELTS